jgi:hypothetical protein
MENSETRATMGISHRTKTNKTKNTIQKANKMSNTDPKELCNTWEFKCEVH